MTLTNVNEYKRISKDLCRSAIVAPASGRYGMPKTREQLLVSLLLNPSIPSMMAHALD
jgi:hypothetical protein